jgi:hypothetical protein
MRSIVLAAAMMAASAGCTKPATQVVVVISTHGIRVPTDVHRLHFKVQDRVPGGSDDTLYEQDIELCHDDLTTGCLYLPISAVLFPGKARPGDSVRVEVLAYGVNNQVLIADAAVFTFAEEQTLWLDFVLYANCIGNVECVKIDKACGPNDQCIDLMPMPMNGTRDLAPQMEVFDLAVPPRDMTLVDLRGADLTVVPPDLTNITDMAGCTSVTCGPMQVCIAGMCQDCGYAGQPCCGPGAAPPPWPNAGGTTGGCNAGNLVCDGMTCVHCGNTSELCCQPPALPCNSGQPCDVSGYCTSLSMPDLLPPLD